MKLLVSAWRFLIAHRMQIAVVIVILSLVAPQPATGQFGLVFGLINIVSSGLGALNDVMSAVNNTLRNLIGPMLQAINSAIFAVQEIVGLIFDFQRNVVYTQSSQSTTRGP